MLLDLRILASDTIRVWWRLLPQVLGIYLLGWLGSELALRAAILAGDASAWLALALFAFSFVSVLVAVVLILSLCGVELGIRRLLPETERATDDRDAGVSRLLAVTLLPFLGMYAAFGQVDDAAERLFTQQVVRYGIISDQNVVSVLSRSVTEHLPRMLLVIVGLYLLRRGLDRLHDRTGLRVLGLLVVLVESFFLLVVVLGGIKVFQTFMLWLRDRAVAQWLTQASDAVLSVVSVFAVQLPELLTRFSRLVLDEVWPVLADVVLQPLLWLAVAALVYGSRVLTLAELWRKTQPYAARVPVMRVLARRRQRPVAQIGPAPKGVRLAAQQVQEAFFGDLSDKYLPTVHSLRLVLRAGVGFLGSFVFAYTMVRIAQNLFGTLVHRLIGGQLGTFWVTWEPLVDLAQNLPFEPLRLCLLAVAFRRCLELFASRMPTPAPTSNHSMAVR